MRTFKRDNWTNEQIIKFLDGQKIVNGDGIETDSCKEHNAVIDNVKAFFYDFTRPIEEFGAMGYCVEEDIIYHIGGIPEEFAKQWKEDRIEL
jgi:hypothetical protein